QSTNSKNWHQQTWHTIEFSNNRYVINTDQINPILWAAFRLFSSAVLNLIPSISSRQIGVSGDFFESNLSSSVISIQVIHDGRLGAQSLLPAWPVLRAGP
ncbi:hypothetical protein ACFFIO_05075, partial [Citricoccus parietis]